MRYPNMRNHENPFRFGTVVDEPYFINREKELREIRQSLISGQNLIIYSPRRYGKTSLITKLIKRKYLKLLSLKIPEFFPRNILSVISSLQAQLPNVP